MLCLHDTIHDDDPAVQRFLSAVEDAHSLTVLILGSVAGGPRAHHPPRRSRVG